MSYKVKAFFEDGKAINFTYSDYMDASRTSEELFKHEECYKVTVKSASTGALLKVVGEGEMNAI